MQKIALVIFDCDGVLVDSELISAQMVVEVFSEIGLNVDLSFVYHNFVGHSFTTVAAKYAREHGKNVPDSFENDYRERLLNAFGGKLKAMAGIETVLDQLNVPFCLASGSSPARVNRSLEVTGLTQRFKDKIFTTSLVAKGKPAPDIFYYAAEMMGAAPNECLVIEDSTAGVDGAKAATMTVWQFTGGVHFNHGYQHVAGPHLVDRRFNRMIDFFDPVPQLRHQ